MRGCSISHAALLHYSPYGDKRNIFLPLPHNTMLPLKHIHARIIVILQLLCLPILEILSDKPIRIYTSLFITQNFQYG